MVELNSIVKADKTQSLNHKDYVSSHVTHNSLYCFDQVVELLMVLVSLRGSVMDDRPRESMQYLVYIKQGTWYLVLAVPGTWYLVFQVVGLHQASWSQ